MFPCAPDVPEDPLVPVVPEVPLDPAAPCAPTKKQSLNGSLTTGITETLDVCNVKFIMA